MNQHYIPSDQAKAASDYFNGLPQEERAKLAPLLEHYRQMGIAEALEPIIAARLRLTARIRAIREGDLPR